MRRKMLGVVAGLALASLATVGAFASQDAHDSQEYELSAASAADENSHEDDVHGIPGDNPSHAPKAGACDEGETSIKTTPSGNEVVVPCHAAAKEHGDGGGENSHQGDVHGIPDDNPSHAPKSGACDKGETAIKTTPSGNEVMVPCHAAVNEHGGGLENDHQADVHGIPDDNISHKVDGGAACDKGETAIKTTPGGNKVMVPCHAADNEHGSE